ncbi:MAG: hypothetical protein U1E36_04115 [Rickettsiales bacterium]
MSSAFKYIVPALAGLSLFPAASHAAEKLYSPYVERGEWEIEYFGSRTNDNDSEKNNAQVHQFSVAYGVNDWWRTELYANFENEPDDNADFEAWEWENIFQLTERGEYWLDVGASIAYEYTPQDDTSDELEARLLLAKDVGKTSHILNVILEKEIGEGERDDLEGGLLWSSRYTITPAFEPGFEISSSFGELDNTGNFDDQQHYIGPTAYGKIPLHLVNNSDGLRYRIGYLFGVSDAAADGDALAQLEYEIRF